MEGLDDLKALLSHFVRGIWRYRWIGLGIAWIALIAGVLFIDQIKSEYTATTKVYIDSSSILKPLLKGLTVEPNVNASVRLVAGQLLSRPNIERLILKLDPDYDVSNLIRLEGKIGDLRSRLKLNVRKGSNYYTLSFSDTDRDNAKRVVQALLDLFVEDSLGKNVTESDTAIEFLDGQIEKYDQLLREAEERRESFKRKNIGLMPKDGANYFDKLQDGELELEKAELLLSESENRREKIQLKLAEMIAGNTNQEEIIKTSLDGRIEKQEEKIDELLLLYTDEHPDVINAKVVLSSLQARSLTEQQEVQNINSNTISNNPVYQELQILLAGTEGDISSYSTRVAALRVKQTKLQKLVNIVPKIEMEMQRLNRDYSVHKKNYSELVTRRETAKISEDVEAGGDQLKFKIIEPPFVPSKSDYPDRPLFDLGALAAALGIGYGISLLISLFQPVFYNQNDMRSAFTTPILGSIKKFDTPAVLSKRRLNLGLFSLGNFFLVCVTGYLIYLHNNDLVIVSHFEEVILNGMDEVTLSRINNLVSW